MTEVFPAVPVCVPVLTETTRWSHNTPEHLCVLWMILILQHSDQIGCRWDRQQRWGRWWRGWALHFAQPWSSCLWCSDFLLFYWSVSSILWLFFIDCKTLCLLLLNRGVLSWTVIPEVSEQSDSEKTRVCWSPFLSSLVPLTHKPSGRRTNLNKYQIVGSSQGISTLKWPEKMYMVVNRINPL